jgi:ATP adenylyltransferase
VSRSGVAEDDERCVFCEEVTGLTPSPLTLHCGDRCLVILNKYPYSNGHLMVVPRRHIGRLSEAVPDELAELMALTQTAEMALAEAYAPQGLNIGMNLGLSAGAGVVGHLHIHVVPRWNGDTNFMTVIADTRVVPEEPAQTVERLRPIFLRLMS